MRILFAEDDRDLGESIVAFLHDDGFTVDWVEDGESALNALLVDEHFDAALLDIGLPLMEGDKVLKTARAKKNYTPVIFLTARDAIDDQIKGLDLGADHYITKPVDLKYLAATLRSLQRRISDRGSTEIINGDVILDPAKNTVTIKGENVMLARREYVLLHKLMENLGTVVTRNVLLQTLYGWGDEVESNTIEVHICNLRKRFNQSLPIKTVRGVGYMVEKISNNDP